MARGFLSGILMGGVVGVSVAAVASVLAPPPMPPVVSDAAPGVTTAPTGGADAKSKGPSEGGGAPSTENAQPQASAPDPDTLTALGGDATQTAAQPATGGAESLSAPAVIADNSAVSVQSDDPVLPNPQSLAPVEPQPAEGLSISTEPAQPPQPSTETVQGAFDDPVAPQTDGAVSEESSLPAQTDGSDAPQVEAANSNTLVQPDADVVVDEVADDAPTQEAAVPEAAQASDEDQAAVDDSAAPEPEAEEETELASAATPSRPAIGTPATSLTEREGSVTVNRLTSAAATSQSASAPNAGAEVLPIQKFAQAFENEEGKPLLSVVLIDDGTSPTNGAAGIAALRSFPYPLSFAVDASLPDAAERMATFRAEGFEVLAMIDLPERATAVDAETNITTILQQLSDVVGVLEGPKTGFQGSKEVSDQTSAILAQSGHGLVTQDKGLNTMPKLARKEGVPAEPIFRDFDGKGQTATVIRRFLDQAAFKAGQDGAVIMMGRLRPDTISALLLWGLQDRAGKVALAPISAVLLQE